jgi:hypothetical protein
MTDGQDRERQGIDDEIVDAHQAAFLACPA